MMISAFYSVLLKRNIIICDISWLGDYKNLKLCLKEKPEPVEYEHDNTLTKVLQLQQTQ